MSVFVARRYIKVEGFLLSYKSGVWLINEQSERFAIVGILLVRSILLHYTTVTWQCSYTKLRTYTSDYIFHTVGRATSTR